MLRARQQALVDNLMSFRQVNQLLTMVYTSLYYDVSIRKFYLRYENIESLVLKTTVGRLRNLLLQYVMLSIV